MSTGFSRRELFSRLFRPARRRAPEFADQPLVAIIQGRYCLAYEGSCSVCADACPVPDALPVTNGIPLVDRDLCTGCAVCQDVCPANPNAILLLPRQPSP